MKRGATSIGDVVEDIVLLKAESGNHGENALDETTTGFRVGTEAAFAPEHGMARESLGMVIGGFDALAVTVHGPR